MTLDSLTNAAFITAMLTVAILWPACWVIGTLVEMLTGRE